MKQVNGLAAILNGHFGWHKSRMDCFAGMLCALYQVSTVNLRKIAVAFASEAQIDSRYLRIKNFFAHFKIDYTKVARFIFSLFFSRDEKIYITIDRTNWKWGRKHINILFLGIAYEGIAIPIIWDLLDNNGGNASAEQHIAIIERFVKIFGKEQIDGILADREFASEDFIKWLKNEEIPFCFRVKKNCVARFFCEKGFHIEKMFKDLPQKQQMYHVQPVTLYGNKVFVAAGRSDSGELLIVVTNQSPKNAVAIYLRRWEIETLFQCLKNRGFHFEDTHITKADRISKLIVLLAIGFCWAHKVGEWRAIKKPISFKRFKGSIRPQYSYFRYGLDLIADTVFQISRKRPTFKQCLLLLQPINSPTSSQIRALS